MHEAVSHQGRALAAGVVKGGNRSYNRWNGDQLYSAVLNRVARISSVERASQALPYQHLLRALGWYLDQERPFQFTLLEVIDGFSLVLRPRADATDLIEDHYTRAALLERAEQLMRGRKLSTRNHKGGHLLPTGYEDFLRALGFELDDAGAHSILIDQQDNVILLTYSYLDLGQGYSWRKRLVTLGRDEIEKVLAAAYDRRQRRGLLNLMK